MAKKKTVAKQPIVNGIAATIKQLHACIIKDQNELAKLYKKAVVEGSKKLIAVKKLFVSAKKAVARKVSKKKKAPKDYASAVNLLQSLKNEWATIKLDLADLKVKHKKFITEQKILKKSDKDLAKPAKTSKAKKKIATATKKPRVTKQINSTGKTNHSPNATDMSSDNTH